MLQKFLLHILCDVIIRVQGVLSGSVTYPSRGVVQYNRMLPDAAVILRDQAEGHLLRQMNYIVAWVDAPEWSPN